MVSLKIGYIGFVALLIGTTAAAAEIPKFGKTCVGNSGLSTSICLTSNGSSVASTYIFRGKYRTTGMHKGCSLKGNSISCSSGSYKTSEGSGKMNAVVIKLSKGKPISIRWR